MLRSNTVPSFCFFPRLHGLRLWGGTASTGERQHSSRGRRGRQPTSNWRPCDQCASPNKAVAGSGSQSDRERVTP